jgi:Uma2 family endonuclease
MVLMWPPVELISIEEYLVREPENEYKSEYRQGRVVAMAGASAPHELIVWNVGTLLGNAFAKRPCLAFLGNMRVQVAEAQFITYPDIAAVCEPPVFRDARRTCLVNPTVLFEVLPPSTMQYDRTEKFDFYKRISSLREYVLVSQGAIHVEHFVRQSDGTWPGTVLDHSNDWLALPSLGCEFPLTDIYRKVTF